MDVAKREGGVVPSATESFDSILVGTRQRVAEGFANAKADFVHRGLSGQWPAVNPLVQVRLTATEDEILSALAEIEGVNPNRRDWKKIGLSAHQFVDAEFENALKTLGDNRNSERAGLKSQKQAIHARIDVFIQASREKGRAVSRSRLARVIEGVILVVLGWGVPKLLAWLWTLGNASGMD